MTGDINRRSCLRVLQATVTQDNRIAEEGSYLYYPAISVKANDELVAVYNRSNSATFVRAVVSGRRPTAPQDTPRPFQGIAQGYGQELWIAVSVPKALSATGPWSGALRPRVARSQLATGGQNGTPCAGPPEGSRVLADKVVSASTPRYLA